MAEETRQAPKGLISHDLLDALKKRITETKLATVGDPELLLRVELTEREGMEILGQAVLGMLNEAGVNVSRCDDIRRSREKPSDPSSKVSFTILFEF